MKKIFVVLGLILSLTLILLVSCFGFLDVSPYQQTAFYKKQIDLLSKLDFSNVPSSDTLNIGWSTVNLQPSFSTPIAIDAERGGKHYTGVHDSLAVRSFVFKQGNKKVAYISADLLIIPPTVTAILDTILLHQGYSLANLFLTATHTHTSIGGWYPSIVGEIFAGKYDSRVPAHIAHCIAQSILKAEQDAQPCKVGFAKIEAKDFVVNRLVRDSGLVDSYLRILRLEKANGENGALITYSAHATIFHEKMMQLSADWPGKLMQDLTVDKSINFASFSAGAVGSQGPAECAKTQQDQVNCMAFGLVELIQNKFAEIKTDWVEELNMHHIPLYLRTPNLRISDQLVLRPWLFHWLFGKEKVYINTLKIGNIFLIGLPCDFSGELVAPLDSVAKLNGLNLDVFSFNGGYIGYITNDKWYNLDAYETKTMGWFGPENGAYFNEIIKRILNRTSLVSNKKTIS